MPGGNFTPECWKSSTTRMELWIEAKLEGGSAVPDPMEESLYSGKFVLRISKTLHARLTMEAEKEGVSLN